MRRMVRRWLGLPVSKFSVGQRVEYDGADGFYGEVGTVTSVPREGHAAVLWDCHLGMPGVVPVAIADEDLVPVKCAMHGFYVALRIGGLFTLCLELGVLLHFRNMWLLVPIGVAALAVISLWNWDKET